MSLISSFVDAFKKAFGGKRKVDIEEVRSSGGLGPSNPTDAFDPIQRTAPTGGSSHISPGDRSASSGDLSVKSGDPEEGGEISAPHGP